MTVRNMNTLHFPTSHSVGWVKTSRIESDPRKKWKIIADAEGDVLVPCNIPIMLQVAPAAAAELNWLQAIEPHQLTELYLGQTDVTNESLKYVSHLTGLEVLTLSHNYDQITDSGIFNIKSLVNLRGLYLNSTNIGDLALSYLKDLTSLEVLSIGATHVTDGGLPYLYGLSLLKIISFDVSYSGGRQNHISKQGLNLLRAALPHCKINIDDL